ncbi:hypothetical protein [Aurantimonas manganoxydans]|uniref:hypothetical protein n=1 Tax=Aurantimonas manganoxydans TaxID=651183 RepID=UPI000B1B2CA9|nr:hypothetical protein [Aurantimonas manganoxydans]
MQSPFPPVRGLFVMIAVAAAAPLSYAGYLQLSGNVHAVENATGYPFLTFSKAAAAAKPSTQESM